MMIQSLQPNLTQSIAMGPRRTSFVPTAVKSLSLDSVILSAQPPDQGGHYSAGQILQRAAVGAIGGAITMALSGGGVLGTAAFGAAVYGVLGGIVGGIAGAVAGSGAGNPAGGAAIGVLAGGAIGAVKGFVKGAILGAFSGLFGGGPLGGAIAGGLISAATA